MQISLYIGHRKKKDKIVNKELEKYVEGDRSDRIKDLILKGLIFEGNTDIDERLLDMRYMYERDSISFKNVETKERVFESPNCNTLDSVEDIRPDFSEIKIKRKEEIMDEELESRI